MVPQKLRIMILKHLAISPQSGYGLTKSIHEATSWKPSYGSMYPQLEHLKEEGLVTVKQEGRKKIYTLTAAGEKVAQEVQEDTSELLQKMRENMNTIAHMMGADMNQHEEMMELFLSAMEKGDNTFKEFEKPSTRMKMAFLKLYKENKLKKNKKQVQAIMDTAAKRMEKLL